MRRLLALVAVAIYAISATSAFAAEKVVLILPWFPNGDQAPAYVAVTKGFFAAEGLDVTIQNARGSVDAFTKVATGTGQFATGELSVLMNARAEGAMPLKAVMSIGTKRPDGLFIVKGGPVKTLKDLVGRTVVIAPFAASNSLWPVFLTVNGIAPASVTLNKVDPGLLIPMLATGRVDAAVNYVYDMPSYEAAFSGTGKEAIVLPWSDYGLDGYGVSVLASEKIIKENPKVVAAFNRAMKKAIEFSLADPDAAAAATHSMAPRLDASKALKAWHAMIPLVKNEISAQHGLGALDPALVKKTWGWVAQAGRYTIDKLDPEKILDRSFIPKM
jgi:NitT/TauT family transport system substrate-binding protein